MLKSKIILLCMIFTLIMFSACFNQTEEDDTLTEDGTSTELSAWSDSDKLFIGVGYPGLWEGGNTQAIIVMSKDGGFTWEKKYSNENFTLTGIAKSDSTFIAVGDTDIVKSSDGENWSEVNHGLVIDGLSAVAYGSGMFVAVGTGSTIVTSTDQGATWTKESIEIDPEIATGSTHLYGIQYINGKFYAVGNGERIVVLSVSGTTLTKESHNSYGLITESLRSIAVNGSGVISAVGTTQDFWSTDGVTWNETTTSWKQFWDIAYGNNIFVAAYGFKTGYYYSEDAKSFLEPNDFSSFYSGVMFSVAYGNGRFVVCGKDGSRVVTKNGLDWVDANPDMSAGYEPTIKDILYFEK